MKQYRIKARSARELVRGVEHAVASGELAPGEQLPSVRRLALETALSPATVSTAMAELRRRGVVLGEPRRATRIAPAPPISSARMLIPVPAGARDLASGNPDPALLPGLQRALRQVSADPGLYGEPPALAGLLDMARRRLRSDLIAGASLCVVSGALDGIERVVQAHLRPGDAVAVESPGWDALFDLLRAYGLELCPVALDEQGMRPQELQAALDGGARAAIITPRGQNPTGAALDAKRARALRAVLAQSPQTLVIEDDHLGPLHQGPRHTALTAGGRWAMTCSVAKAFGPDLRLAILTGDELTVARVQGRQRCGPGWVSHILQQLVLSLWSDPAVQSRVRRAAGTYARRRQRLVACLARRGLQASGRSGLNVWVAVREEAATVGALLQRGWVVAPGSPYRLGGAPPSIRVTISTLREPEAERFAADLAEITGASGMLRTA
jgi:DNA-binding transcriptional MocR family regulator